MFATRVRASRLFVAVSLAVCAACNGGARTASPTGPLTVEIGTFVSKSGPSSLMDLAGVFSSEPLIATAWDGRRVYRLAESVVESEDGRALTVTLDGKVRFHTGDRITAPVVRELMLRKLPRLLPEVSDIVVLDDRRLELRLSKPSSLKPEDLSAILVDSNDTDKLALRTGPFKFVSTDPM